MTMLSAIVHELTGLFVEDGALALAIIAVVAVAGLAAAFGLPMAAGAVLLLGCLGVLAVNVMRAGRR